MHRLLKGKNKAKGDEGEQSEVDKRRFSEASKSEGPTIGQEAEAITVFPTTPIGHPDIGFGVQPLVEPETAVVDIVFVHGLTGSSATTWLHRKTATYWPTALLTQEFPDARLLAFGYDADVVNFWSPTSQNRIGNHARNLIGDLTRKREKTDTEDRKIIFVAHSLGGLVVENALCLSKNHVEKHLRNFSNCTVGIIFLGTPHHGADLAAWASCGAKFAQLLKDASPDILGVLKRDSEVLAEIEDQFHGLLRIRRDEESEICVTCFYEELQLPVVGKVVEMDSAIIAGYSHYGIHANHMDMCRFANDKEHGYEAILGELRRWVKLLRKVPSQPTATAPGPAVFSSESYYEYGGDDLSQHFTGRKVVLDQIAETFFVDSSSQQGLSVVVLHGTGGIGKSQIAAKFASLHRSRYKIIYKVDCTDRTTVEEGLDVFAREVLFNPPETPRARLIKLKAVLGSSDKSWLLIFDGYDRIQGTQEWFRLDQFFPRTCSGTGGNVIITSKYDENTSLGKGIRVSLLDPQEAAKLFLATSGIEESKLEPGDISTACEQLDRIPLAVDIAGNYIRNEISRREGETSVEQMALKDYLLRHERKRVEFREHLLRHRSSISTHRAYEHTIFAAWFISFKVIQAIDEPAAKLLLLLSFLDPVAVSSESAYIRNACVLRRRWNKEGNLQILDASEVGMPDWLLNVVGEQEVLENGRPGIGSIKLETAVSLLISYSLLRKYTNIGNGYDNWGSHSVHRDCARIYCTEQQQSLELSACALNIFFANRPEVEIETGLKTPEKRLHASSMLLLESFLTSDALFRPFKNCLDDFYTWDRIIKTIVAATDIQAVHSLGLNMAEPLTALAFIACVMARVPVGHSVSPSVLRESLHAVSLLKADTFDGTHASVLYHCYRVDYFISGKGLSTLYPEPSKLADSKALDQILNFFETRKSFEEYTLDRLNAISDILVALSKLFVFNEMDDNPALNWDDDSLRQIWPQWLNLRHSGLLRKYAEQCETFISHQKGELLLRTRARLFLEFSRELSGIPRFVYAFPSKQGTPSFQEQKIANELLLSLAISMSDLEELSIDHICATGFALYFIFDLLGYILRVGQSYSKSIFEEGASIFLSRTLRYVSQIMKHPLHSKMLKELLSEKLSHASWSRSENCVFCSKVWGAFMKTKETSSSLEDIAEKMVSSFHDANEIMMQQAVTLLEYLQTCMNRFESVDPSDYANRDKIEGQIEKLLAQISPHFASQSAVYDQDALVQQFINETVPLFSSPIFGESIEPYLVSKIANMPKLDNSRLLQLRQECFGKLRADQQIQLTSQIQPQVVMQESDARGTGSSAISGIDNPQSTSTVQDSGWGWLNKHNAYKFSELRRIIKKSESYGALSHDRLVLWIETSKDHSDWPIVPDSTTFKTLESITKKTKQSSALAELEPLYEHCRHQIEERDHAMEIMEDHWKLEHRDYLIDFQIQHLNLALQYRFD